MEYPNGDKIGVVKRWTPPTPGSGAAAMPVADVCRALDAIEQAAGGDNHRKDGQAAGWVGYVVADALGLDVGPCVPKDKLSPDQEWNRGLIRECIKHWLAQGYLGDTLMPAGGKNVPVLVRGKSSPADAAAA